MEWLLDRILIQGYGLISLRSALPRQRFQREKKIDCSWTPSGADNGALDKHLAIFRSVARFGFVVLPLIFQIPAAVKGQKVFELGRPLYQFYTTRDYGGDNQTWNAVQDRDGPVFFGNRSAVLEYDGQRWDHIPVPGGFTISGLAIDSTGVIWVGGTGTLGRLARDGNHYRFEPAK